MDNTGQIIERVFSSKNVSKADAFQHIVQCLSFSHQMMGLNGGKSSSNSILSELAYLAKFSGREGQQPASVLDAIHMAVRAKFNQDDLNLQLAKKSEKNEGVPALSARVELGTAILLALQECMNKFEHRGLEHGIRSEKMIQGMLYEFSGGRLDGQKRVLTSTYNAGDEVKVEYSEDLEWVDIYEMREGKRCVFLRKERR